MIIGVQVYNHLQTRWTRWKFNRTLDWLLRLVQYCRLCDFQWFLLGFLLVSGGPDRASCSWNWSMTTESTCQAALRALTRLCAGWTHSSSRFWHGALMAQRILKNWPFVQVTQKSSPLRSQMLALSAFSALSAHLSLAAWWPRWLGISRS